MLPCKVCEIGAALDFLFKGLALTFAVDKNVSGCCSCHWRFSDYALLLHIIGDFAAELAEIAKPKVEIGRTRSMTPETQYDVACLLAMAASSDGSIDTQESERLVTAMQHGFAVKSDAALKLVVRALDDVKQHPDVSSLLRKLQRALDKNQKETLVVMLLEVIAADNMKDAREIKLLDSAMTGLKISDQTMDRAYRRYFAQRKSTSK